MTSISKSFGSVRVLKDVDFTLRPGEVHALAGENGAGKSTLMKILQGVYSMDNGEIRVNGQAVRLTDTFSARAAGIGMVFQEFSLVPTLTVAQNIFLTTEPRGALGLISDRKAEDQARQIFEGMGVTVDPSRPMEQLSTAYWQLTEIAKALAQEARVIIMDEPTASLAKHEAEKLFELIGKLKARGISIIYISHRMDEIYRIADRITVLRDGALVLDSDINDVTPAAIVEAIVGREISATLDWKDRETVAQTETVLEARNLSSGDRVRDVSFAVHAGEIVGLAGLMGSGRTELVQALFGMGRVTSGVVEIEGRPVRLRNAEQAIAAGLALIPEDRRIQGLVLEHSVRDNLLLPLLDRVSSAGFLSRGKIAQLTAQLISRLSIRVANAGMPVGQLSGGNQQKVVIAKWLGTDPRVLLLDEPTAGVDIGTKSEILDMVRKVADGGKAVVFISSELPELLAISDRILVIRNGEITKGLTRAEIPNEEYLQLAVQGA
jgi:ribose transport system ATP-binding protein